MIDITILQEAHFHFICRVADVTLYAYLGELNSAEDNFVILFG